MIGSAGVVALAGIGFATVHKALAANATSLSDAMATKLNVPSADVQSAIDAFKTQKKTDMQAAQRTKYSDKLTAAVTAGTLTADQKTKLLSEFDSVQTKVEALHTQLQQVATDAKAWASSNGIDAKWLPGKEMGGGPGHGAGRKGMGDMPDAANN